MSQVIPVAKAYVIGNGKDATSSIELGAATLLSNCNTLRLKQGRAVAEAFSCGAVPNIYTIADFNSMYQQQRNGKPWRDPVPLPIFFIGVMVMNGLTLEGADIGIRMYLKGIKDGVEPDL